MGVKYDYILGKLREEDSGSGNLTIEDEGTPIQSNVTTINFIGVDVQAKSEPGKVNVFIPTPNYASHYNTTDGNTNAIVNDVNVSNRNMSAPTSEGNPFKLGSWNSTEIHPATNAKNGSLNASESVSFKDDSSTNFIVTVYDADDTTILAQHSINNVSGNYNNTVQNITIEISNWGADNDQFKANVNVNVDWSSIVPNSGRFKIECKHEDSTDGTFTKEQTFFYDSESNALTTGAFNSVENTVVTKQISGVKFYTLNSSFDLDLSDIDYYNADTYKDYMLRISAIDLGISQINLKPSDLNNWVETFDNTGASYTITDLKIDTANVCNIVNNDSMFKVNMFDWNTVPIITSQTASDNWCINTLSANETSIFEDFRNENLRLDTTTLNSYDSTVDLNTNTELQITCDRLVYPTIDFSNIKPDTTNQPNYSTCSGDRTYVRDFNHNGTSHSNGILRLGDYNITQSEFDNKDVLIEISLDGTAWYSLNDLYAGGALSDGDGCRTNPSTHALDIDNQLEFTFGTGGGTDATTGKNGWGAYFRITFKDNATGKAKYLGNFQVTNWV